MKTTRLFITLALITISPIIVNAQFFAEINTGYAAPINFLGYNHNKHWQTNDYRYYDYMQGIDTSYYVYNKFNMGNGSFLNGELGYHFNNKLEFSLNVYFLNNNEFDVFYNSFTRETVRMSNQYFEDDSTSSFSSFSKEYSYFGKRLSFSPMGSYTFSFNKFRIQPSLGLSISYITLYRNTTLNTNYIDTDNHFENKRIEKEEWKEYFKKNHHLGVNLSISTFFKLNQSTELKFCIESNLLLASQIDEGIQYYYSHYYELNNEVLINSVEKTILFLVNK